MAGYPIEMDPHEDLNAFGLFPFATEPALKVGTFETCQRALRMSGVGADRK